MSLRRNRPIRTLSAEALFAVALLAPAAAWSKTPPSTDDFVKQARATDAFERQANELAQARANGADVRVFADMIVRDRAKAEADFEAALNAGGKPSAPAVPTAEQAKMLADLQAASDRAFDKIYIHGQVKVNAEALAAVRAYAKDGDNPALKQAAALAEPVIQHDLQMAQITEANVR